MYGKLGHFKNNFFSNSATFVFKLFLNFFSQSKKKYLLGNLKQVLLFKYFRLIYQAYFCLLLTDLQPTKLSKSKPKVIFPFTLSGIFGPYY